MLPCRWLTDITLDARSASNLPGRSPVMVIAALFAFLAASFVSQVERLQADEELDFLPGLVARLESQDGAAVERVDRLVHLTSPSGASDPRLAGTLKSAQWLGYLMSQNPGQYRLAAFVTGNVTLRVAGRTALSGKTNEPSWLVSEPLELEFDWHPLDVEFEPTGADAQLSLYWTGPGFHWEPLGSRQLYHDPETTPSDAFERGALLARALRCEACHSSSDLASSALPSEEILPAPSLRFLKGALHEAWAADWLTATPPGSDVSPDEEPSRIRAGVKSSIPTSRRMPYFAMAEEEQLALRHYLLSASDRRAHDEDIDRESPSGLGGEESKEWGELVEKGETLLLSLGCLACHEYSELGQSGLFGGGDLTAVARKRPAHFFAQWLSSPETRNPNHRMPVYNLEDAEIEALAAFLGTLRGEVPDRGASAELTTLSENLAPLDDSRSTDTPSSRKADTNRQADNDRGGAEKQRAPLAGAAVFARFGCGACHEGPQGEVRPEHEEQPDREDLEDLENTRSRVGRLTPESAWSRSCAGRHPAPSHAPSFALNDSDQEALRLYFSSISSVYALTSATESSARRDSSPSRSSDGELTGVTRQDQRTLEHRLVEHNCVACHARGDHAGLASHLPAVAEHFPKLAEQLPALSPPSLNSVGDKLKENVLGDVVAQRGPVHRPWLQVRMPRFRLTEAELQQLVQGLITSDRIPDGLPRDEPAVTTGSLDLADLGAHVGARLVTADGFGCTSCHAVGRISPPQGPLNTLGPNLAMLEQRIRRPWFDRWVRNPARIVPRMEMPSVQTPVRGVLDEDLDLQLAAVWRTLNEPDFRPPAPNPVRTLRRSGVPEIPEPAVFVTEVTKVDDKTYIKPLIVGLANRHNLLFDFEENRLSHWWLGDTARQRTLGKTWFWEPGSPDVTTFGSRDHEWGLRLGDDLLEPRRAGQFLTEFDELRHVPDGIELRHRVHFGRDDAPVVLQVTQKFLGPAGEASWIREIKVSGIPAGGSLLLHFAGSDVIEKSESAEPRPAETGSASPGRRVLDEERGIWIELLSPEPGRWDGEDAGSVTLVGNASGEASLRLAYHAGVPVDLFPPAPEEDLPAVPESLRVVPGFTATRLPLPRDVMPTGLAWDGDGHLLIASLKGRVWRASDRDGDGLEETLSVVSDDLAAPYGIAAGNNYVDVTTRYGLVRLLDENGDGFAERTQMLYSGWGHTDDYHDWTVGLPRDEQGNYYVSVACQQDQRSIEAARMRGTVLRLVPREPTPHNPQRFTAEVMSIGHRFPMGIARNCRGDLFTTDNQGNYKPFNQLNHVLWGADYGFINAVDRPQAAQRGPAEPAAVEIPHPWTRSVNGICFLETPAELDGRRRERRADDGTTSQKEGHFGPFEGHLVGCEYDTRRLIRMSLQRVGDVYQGAAYPFSLYEPIEGPTFLGPLVSQVSPSGDLYVGCIRDSGWGGANNIGGVVKMTIQPDEISPGIAEVRALSTGFEIEFTQPVDSDLARDPGNYSLSSYRRVATPAYGGADQDRRQERITEIELEKSNRQVRLQLESLRVGTVYEFHLRNLAGSEELFFPAEAHYTLRAIPAPPSE